MEFEFFIYLKLTFFKDNLSDNPRMVYILDRKRVKDKISYDFIKNFINIRYQRKSIFPE